MRKLFLSLFTLLCLTTSVVSEAVPIIQSISPSTVTVGTSIRVSGSGFGTAGKGSEIIAGYGQGLFYALKVESWSDRSITVRVPDLGKSLNLSLHVKTAQGRNAKKNLKLIPKIITEKSRIYQYKLKVGDKGEELYQIKSHIPKCNKRGELYVGAEVKVLKRRFADAQIVSNPKESCVKCRPIKVRWFNEPTGYISYQIEVKKRVIEGVCSDRKR